MQIRRAESLPIIYSKQLRFHLIYLIYLIHFSFEKLSIQFIVRVTKYKLGSGFT